MRLERSETGQIPRGAGAEPATVPITGDTYPHRAALHELGARWNRVLKQWDCPAERAEEARALVNGGAQGRRGFHRSGSGRSVCFRFSSGAEMYQNENGRCIDAPCCGCCS